MNDVRSLKVRQLGKTFLVSLLSAALAVAFAVFMGRLVVSPNWQDAVRLVVLGGLIVTALMSPINGLWLWITLAPYAQAPYTTIWRILNLRLPPGVPDLTMDRLAIAVLSVVWVAELAAGRKRMRRLGAVEVFMASFCVMALPSVVAGLSGINRTSQVFFDKFVTPFLAFILAKNLYSENSGLDKLGLTLAVIGVYLSFMVFYEHMVGQPLFYIIGRTTAYTRSLPKIVSLLGNPAFLGTVLGMIVPIALFKLVQDRSLYARAFYSMLFLATLLGNFFCYNRGAWLALATGLFVLLLFERRYRYILLPILLIATIVGLMYWQVLSESAVITERLYNVSSIRFRLSLLEVSRKMIRDHLLFGVGFDNFAYYYLQYGGHWETLAYDLPSPHNTYILVLSTMGLASLIPYVLIFLSMFLEIGAMLHSVRGEKRIESALMASGWAVIAIYTVSAAAVDLYINAFTSLVFFAIMGTILGHASHLRSSYPQETQV